MSYVPLFFFIIFFEFFRKKKQKVDTLSIFGFSYLLGYVITLMLWGLVPEKFSRIPYSLSYNASEQIEVILVFYSAYFLFVAFYYFINLIRFKFLINFYRTENNYINLDKKVLLICSFFCLIVMFNIIYTGGVSDYITAGNEARHNQISFGIGGYLNYFLSASLSVFILLSFVYTSSNSISIKSLVFLFAFILFIGMLSRGGRGGIVFSVIYLIIYLYSIDVFRLKLKNVFIVAISSIFILFVIYNLRNITQNFIAGNEVFYGIDLLSFFESFSNMVIYPFTYAVHKIFIVSEFYADPDLYHYPRLGADIISGFVIVLPGLSGESLGLPILPDIISQTVMGKDNGYIPPGWVGWSLIDGNAPFLFAKLFWSAFFCVLLDKSYRLMSVDLFGKTIYMFLVLFLTDTLFVGTSMNLVRGNIGDIALILFLFFIPFVRVGKLKLVTCR
ncbi:O-antigen polymerase [Vibrio cyclitrophicus]